MSVHDAAQYGRHVVARARPRLAVDDIGVSLDLWRRRPPARRFVPRSSAPYPASDAHSERMSWTKIDDRLDEPEHTHGHPPSPWRVAERASSRSVLCEGMDRSVHPAPEFRASRAPSTPGRTVRTVRRRKRRHQLGGTGAARTVRDWGESGSLPPETSPARDSVPQQTPTPTPQRHATPRPTSSASR